MALMKIPRIAKYHSGAAVGTLDADPFQHSPAVDKIFRDNRSSNATLVRIDLGSLSTAPLGDIEVDTGGQFISAENSEMLISEGTVITDGNWKHTAKEKSGPLVITGPEGVVHFDGVYDRTNKYQPNVVRTREQLGFLDYKVECQSFTVPEGWAIREWPRTANPRWIKSNLIIKRQSRGETVYNVAENEQVAIETLREMISETEYRKYMNYGFIVVQGTTGKTYQISRNRSHTKVWKGGKLIEEVCIHIKDSKIPPTDSVIAFKTMIEIDEEEFRKSGNVYNMRKRIAA